METEQILELFDLQMRRNVAGPDGLYVSDGWSAVLWPPEDGDVERVVARMRKLPGYVEWKLYGHDRPDLPERLRAAGLEPDELEVVLVAESEAIAHDVDLPEGVEVRVGDAEAFVSLTDRVFGNRYGGGGTEMFRDADRRVPVVCFANGEPVSGGRVDFDEGCDFAGCFGGVTLPEWRGRGLYRATVAKRAQLAHERGYRYLYVDALPTSRPILERLGFVQITTTSPWTFTRRDATTG